MKKLSVFGLILVFPLFAKAATGPYLPDFINGDDTGKAYNSLISKQNLPEWVKVGGASSPAEIINIKGEKFYALSGCKPHNCTGQSIAVLYSIDNKEIYGVYSEYNDISKRQTLKWMNIDPYESLEMKNALLERL